RLSLHDALPIWRAMAIPGLRPAARPRASSAEPEDERRQRAQRRDPAHAGGEARTLVAAVDEDGAKPGAAGALDVGDEAVAGVDGRGWRDAERARRAPKDRRVRLGR